MKYCFHCGKATAGDPLFCHSCGRSFDVKLCPRLHRNPRHADCCSQCGSRDLSTPQPKVSIGSHALIFLVRVGTGIGLGLLTLFLGLALLSELVRTEAVQNGLLGIGILIALLWGMWMLLPKWLRKFIHNRMKRKERNHERRHEHER